MNEIVKEHLISAGQTFVSTFLVVLGTTIATGQIAWTGAFWSSVLLVAVRAGIKEVFARVAPVSLGGRKK